MWRYRDHAWAPGRPETVSPMRVVRDDERGLVAWLAPETPQLTKRHPDGSDLRDVPIGERYVREPHRVQARSRWRGAGILRIAPAGTSTSRRRTTVVGTARSPATTCSTSGSRLTARSTSRTPTSWRRPSGSACSTATRRPPSAQRGARASVVPLRRLALRRRMDPVASRRRLDPARPAGRRALAGRPARRLSGGVGSGAAPTRPGRPTSPGRPPGTASSRTASRAAGPRLTVNGVVVSASVRARRCERVGVSASVSARLHGPLTVGATERPHLTDRSTTMGLPPQAARIAGSWPRTHEPQRRPARPTRTPWLRSSRRVAPRPTVTPTAPPAPQPARRA